MTKKHIIKDFDLEKVDWEKVKNPSPLFQIFQPTDEKLKEIATRLMNDYLYLQDIDRDYDKVWKGIFDLFPPNGTPPRRFDIIYEMGDFDGYLTFNNIVIGYKSSLSFKLWNPKRWGADLAREGKELIQFIVNEFKLKRLSTESPDERMVKMSKMVGFKVEGAMKNAFLWDGDLYTLWMMSITR